MDIPVWKAGTFQPVEKLEAHQRGDQHLAVSVFLFRGNETLIQRRALSKYHTPGLWANSCCTHPFWGEATADCAHRRLMDELGISGVTLELKHRVIYRADVGDDLIENEVVDVFAGEFSSDTTIDPNPDEVADVRWIELETLRRELAADPSKFTPWLRIYMQDHFQSIRF